MTNRFLSLVSLLTLSLAPSVFASTGDKISIAKAPWNISMRSPDYYHGCGGVLIAPRWILTAGHCLDWFDKDDKISNQVSVWGGSDNLKNLRHLPAIKAVYLAPGFSHETVKIHIFALQLGSYETSTNDIGLIELESDVDMTPVRGDGQNDRAVTTLKPIPFETNPIEKGSKISLSGWGTVPRGTSGPKTADGVSMNLRSYTEIFNGEEEVIHDLEVVGGHSRTVRILGEQKELLTTFSENTFCQGDSGSGLSTILPDGSAVLSAIASGSESDCEKGGLEDATFVRIAPFREWITKLTGVN